MALKGRIKGATHRLILRLVEKVEHGHIVVQGAQIKRLRRSAIGILIGDPAEALEAKRELLHGMHHESDSLGDVRHHLMPHRVAIVCLRGLTLWLSGRRSLSAPAGCLAGWGTNRVHRYHIRPGTW